MIFQTERQYVLNLIWQILSLATKSVCYTEKTHYLNAIEKDWLML